MLQDRKRTQRSRAHTTYAQYRAGAHRCRPAFFAVPIQRSIHIQPSRVTANAEGRSPTLLALRCLFVQELLQFNLAHSRGGQCAPMRGHITPDGVSSARLRDGGASAPPRTLYRECFFDASPPLFSGRSARASDPHPFSLADSADSSVLKRSLSNQPKIYQCFFRQDVHYGP
jgi:hypothetical protein